MEQLIPLFSCKPRLGTIGFQHALAVLGRYAVADGAAIFWDPTSGAQLLTLASPGADTQSLAFSADGKWLAIGSGDNTARVWEVATGRETYTLPGGVGGVVGVAFHPKFGGDQLAVASADGVVRVFLLKIDDLWLWQKPA